MTASSPEETIDLGAKIARNLDREDLIALEGELGAGKTVFVKGLAKGLGVEDYLYVNSPSFVIIKEYHGRVDLYHFDVYRLDEGSFIETLDYQRYFYGDGITVIEWADKIKDVLPNEYLEIKITHAGLEKRHLEFRGHGPKYSRIVGEL